MYVCNSIPLSCNVYLDCVTVVIQLNLEWKILSISELSELIESSLSVFWKLVHCPHKYRLSIYLSVLAHPLKEDKPDYNPKTISSHMDSRSCNRCEIIAFSLIL